MVRDYYGLGRRVRSAPKPIVVRTAPSRERPTIRDLTKSKKEYNECISSCVASQRECHTDARKIYQGATKECVDNRRGCITTCKKPVLLAREE